MSDAARYAGLSTTEAHSRLAAEGPNELPGGGRRGLGLILINVLREPMLALLLAGGLIYLALGDDVEAIVLLVFASFSVTITVVQEVRSERALEALRDLASPRALVVRDGVRGRIPGRDVVRDDLVVLNEGDRVPADGWVVENAGLRVDESLLTGESVAVAKVELSDPPPEDGAPPRAGGEGLAYVFAGSLVVGGNGLCRVAATGARTEMGRIGQSLATLVPAVPHLSQQIRRIVLLFAAGAAVASLITALFYGMVQGNWLTGALAGIALGMALLPEEFPVVLTVFMAMGAIRLSRAQVLTRRAAAIETLGSATLLCTDKTGTLTQNRMAIAQLFLPGGQWFDADESATLPPEFWPLVETGILASAPRPVDPMEIAFRKFGARAEVAQLPSRTDDSWTLRHRYPLDSKLLAMSHVWDVGEAGAGQIVAAKGAPESIAELCALRDADRAAIDAAAKRMAAAGLRVLGIAEAAWSGAPLPPTQRDFDFRFSGLVGLYDPLRPSVPDAMRQCAQAGIRVVMITGDYPETAVAIARRAGIADGGDAVMTGARLDALSDADLARCIGDVAVFARIMPEQKLRIVDAFKAAGEVVAMTGDGVNDAPSLKAAHIGIAMGRRGTDVAREAASLVLLDDDFGSIVTGIRLGRRIYDNLRKAMGFIVAVHIPIAGLAMMPLAFGLPILLGPIHIALLEMIIDPMCSLVFEAERDEADVMERPPRRRDATLLSADLLGWAAVQGVLGLAVIGALIFWMNASGVGEMQLRTVAFLALVTTVVALVVVNRAFSASIIDAVMRPNLAFVIALTGVVTIVALAQSVAPVQRVLGMESLQIGVGATIAAAGGLLIGMLEAIKRYGRRRHHDPARSQATS